MNEAEDSWVVYTQLEGGSPHVVASEEDWPPKTGFIGNGGRIPVPENRTPH